MGVFDALSGAGAVGCGRGPCTAELGEVPITVRGLDQGDGGLIDAQAGDVQLARSDQRPELDPDGERFSLHERRAAVGRIVGNREVVGGDGAGEDGELEVAQFDFASQRLGKAGFQHGAKAVGVDQEGQREGADQQEGDERACDESDAFHWRLRVYYLKDSLHMRRTGKILAGVFALLLAGCLAAVWLTRDTAPNRAVEQVSVVDRRVLVTARQIAGTGRDDAGGGAGAAGGATGGPRAGSGVRHGGARSGGFQTPEKRPGAAAQRESDAGQGADCGTP